MKSNDWIFKKNTAYDVNEKSERLNGNETFKFYNKYLKRQLEKLKDNPTAWNNLAIALAKNGDYDEAKKVFAKAIANGDKQAQANAQELDKLMETL